MSRWRPAGVALAALIAVAGAGQGPVRAQAPPTTVGFLEGLIGGLFPATTLPPPPTIEPTPPENQPPPEPDPAPAPAPAATGSASADGPRVVPPDAQQIISSVRRSGGSDTRALLEALGPLTNVGLTLEEAAIIGMGQFPVAGEAAYRDDWLEARFTPAFHHHMGTDIFAARGTPVRSPADGTLRFSSEAVGGLSAYVQADDGTSYYMAHLERFSTQVRSGQRVVRSTVVGFVGSSGNADGSAPHVHFEVRPRGGAPVNPKPILDRWQQEAMASVPGLLSGYQLSVSRAFTAAGLLRRFEVGSFAGSGSSEGPHMWASAVRTASVGGLLGDGSGLSTARLNLGSGAASRGGQGDLQRSIEMAHAVLAPVTPAVLVGLLGD